MTLTKTYRDKLYRHKKNRLLHQQIDIASIIYNHCLALHKQYYRRYGKYLKCARLQKHLAKRSVFLKASLLGVIRNVKSEAFREEPRFVLVERHDGNEIID